MRSIHSIYDRWLLNILEDVREEMMLLFNSKLKQIVLYGSYARGDHEPESDIEIMVVIDENEETLREYRNVIADVVEDISSKYEQPISLTEIPYNRYTTYQNVLPFYKIVYQEGVEIYGNESTL